MGHPTDLLLVNNIVEIIPREDDPDEVLRLQTTLKTTPGRFINNGKGNETITDGPRIHDTIK